MISKLQHVFGIQTIALVWLMVIINIKGGVYDGLKQEKDKSYNKNHTFSFTYGRFRFSIPWIIKDNSRDSYIIKIRRSYNRNSAIFWINIGLMILIYFYAY